MTTYCETHLAIVAVGIAVVDVCIAVPAIDSVAVPALPNWPFDRDSVSCTPNWPNLCDICWVTFGRRPDPNANCSQLNSSDPIASNWCDNLAPNSLQIAVEFCSDQPM